MTSSEEFRQFGTAMINYVADYLDNIRDRRVVPEVGWGRSRYYVLLNLWVLSDPSQFQYGNPPTSKLGKILAKCISTITFFIRKLSPVKVTIYNFI